VCLGVPQDCRVHDVHLQEDPAEFDEGAEQADHRLQPLFAADGFRMDLEVQRRAARQAGEVHAAVRGDGGRGAGV
jgi:hypothetical protein